jgi:uncharacterized membrane protein
MTDASTDSSRSNQSFAARHGAQLIAAGAIVVAASLVVILGHPHLRAPDLKPILEASTPIRIHLGAAVVCLALGAVQMLSPKGTLPHRLIGWIWVTLMMLLAGTSIFIKTIFPGHFSYIHLLTAWVLLITPVAVMAARRGRIEMHSRSMTGLFYLGLITAGAFTFMPGRILYKVFFGG